MSKDWGAGMVNISGECRAAISGVMKFACDMTSRAAVDETALASGIKMSSKECPSFATIGGATAEGSIPETTGAVALSLKSGVAGSALCICSGELPPGLRAGVDGRVANVDGAVELRLPMLVRRESFPLRRPSYGLVLFFDGRSSPALRLVGCDEPISGRSPRGRKVQSDSGVWPALLAAPLLTPVDL